MKKQVTPHQVVIEQIPDNFTVCSPALLEFPYDYRNGLAIVGAEPDKKQDYGTGRLSRLEFQRHDSADGPQIQIGLELGSTVLNGFITPSNNRLVWSETIREIQVAGGYMHCEVLLNDVKLQSPEFIDFDPAGSAVVTSWQELLFEAGSRLVVARYENGP